MTNGRYLANSPTQLAFGRYAASQLAQGATLRKLAADHGMSRMAILRRVRAAERIDGPSDRLRHTELIDPLLQ